MCYPLILKNVPNNVPLGLLTTNDNMEMKEMKIWRCKLWKEMKWEDSNFEKKRKNRQVIVTEFSLSRIWIITFLLSWFYCCWQCCVWNFHHAQKQQDLFATGFKTCCTCSLLLWGCCSFKFKILWVCKKGRSLMHYNKSAYKVLLYRDI